PKPEITKGLSNFKDIDWSVVHRDLMSDETITVNEYNEILSTEDINILEDYNIIYVDNGGYLSIDDPKYYDINNFLSAVKKVYERETKLSEYFDNTNNEIKDSISSIEEVLDKLSGEKVKGG